MLLFFQAWCYQCSWGCGRQSDHGGVWGDGSEHGPAAQGCPKVQSWEPDYPRVGGDMWAGECLWSRGQPGCPKTELVKPSLLSDYSHFPDHAEKPRQPTPHKPPSLYV